jgi:hypothetical protein
VAIDLLEGIPVGLCPCDVVGPFGDGGGRPGGPAVDGLVDLVEELADEDEPGESFRMATPVLEVLARYSGRSRDALFDVCPNAGDRGEDVVLGTVLGEEHFHQLLDLDLRPFSSRWYALGERSSALGGDLVAGAGSAADVVGASACKTGGDATVRRRREGRW